ncbi:MAG: L-2-hydroxyglutarate oxidase [Bacteroidales bacterium]|nr:L-2-hydroxyglutarate oxidase [Bacteroidales bacterium]
MTYDIIVIGGGIVGLATALKLKEKNKDLKIALLEKESKLAQHQTGNNSGVIHSGLYYRPGSLKAQNCIKGYRMLLDFCDKEGVKYDLCGKIVVATRPKDLPRMEMLMERGIANGLTNIKKITSEEIKNYEPECSGLAGIWVPYTGIIDFVEVSNKYAEVFTQKYGGEIFLNHKVTNITVEGDIATVETTKQSFSAKKVVNTAGLYCDKIAGFTMKNLDYRIIPFRGEYSDIKKESHGLVKNLIYPVPDPDLPFLGVHFTRMMKGGLEAGPNSVWAFKREGYKKTDISISDMINSLAWPGFRKVIRKYWKSIGLGEYWRSFNKYAMVKSLQLMIPNLKKEDLVRGGAGVRAQACDRLGNLCDDFIILEHKNIINVLNAPSPAATSSLAIGDHISDRVLGYSS